LYKWVSLIYQSGEELKELLNEFLAEIHETIPKKRGRPASRNN